MEAAPAQLRPNERPVHQRPDHAGQDEEPGDQALAQSGRRVGLVWLQGGVDDRPQADRDERDEEKHEDGPGHTRPRFRWRVLTSVTLRRTSDAERGRSRDRTY